MLISYTLRPQLNNKKKNMSQVSYSDFVRRLFNRSGDPSKDFAHAILGIVTEIHEFQNATDEVNAMEEAGDLTFYDEALRQVVQDHLPADLLPAPEGLRAKHLGDLFAEAHTVQDAHRLIRGKANDLLDQAKRWVGYGKEPADLARVYRDAVILSRFAREIGIYGGAFTRDQLVSSNMAKLLKRYPGGEFDAFRALQRDLVGERSVLEAAQ